MIRKLNSLQLFKNTPVHPHQSYFESIILFFKISERGAVYESHSFCMHIILTNGKSYTRDTQKNIVGLLEMVKPMADTNITVSEDKKRTCIFRKAQAHPVTYKTHYSKQ